MSCCKVLGQSRTGELQNRADVQFICVIVSLCCPKSVPVSVQSVLSLCDFLFDVVHVVLEA